MAGLRSTFDQAIAHHLSALGKVNAVRASAQHAATPGPDPASVAAETAIAQRLSAAAAALRDQPGYVRIGQAQLHQANFPVYVPFLGTAHINLSADSRDPRVAALFRSVLLQTMATAPGGQVEVVTIDPAAVGATFAALQLLIDARLMTTPATDNSGIDRALALAEEHVKASLRGEKATTMILAVTSAPKLSGTNLNRLQALAHSGTAARLYLLAGGVGELANAVDITVDQSMWVGNPPDAPFGQRNGLAAPVGFEEPPGDDYLRAESNRIAQRARAAAQLRFVDLAPKELWLEDPSDGVSTIAGRDANGIVELAFDDSTPHWLIGGRTGGGKTVFLLDILYGLAARYSPKDLALYLLDFKEGVSFTEFTPQASDPTYIPHARAVGVESDREYGVAILRELDEEMTRRSVVMKRHGVARYSQLSVAEPMPRIVCIVDEFQVLFSGNDSLSKQAVAILENLARKGRSYGVHLVLASQTTSGIEALYTKRDSIFGQFSLRVALPGATSVLETTNTAAQSLSTGEAVINTDGGVAGRDRKIRFPNAHAEADALYRLRYDMWQRRGDAPEPSVFYGYAAAHIEDNEDYDLLTPTDSDPRLLLGRGVDARLQTASMYLDATPGRHLSILGADAVGADLVRASALSLVKQKPDARLYIAPFAQPNVAQELAMDAPRQSTMVQLSDMTAVMEEMVARGDPAYLIGFGLDAANLDMAGRNALKSLLRNGPGFGVHLIGWWRGLRRFVDDVGGSAGREDVSCSVVLNIPGSELMGHFGQSVTDWTPRPGRAMLIDRHANSRQLLVPFTRKDLP